MRHDLRQEPYAVVPHVRICAGAAGQPASLPQPVLRHARVVIRERYRGQRAAAPDPSRPVATALYSEILGSRTRKLGRRPSERT